MEWIKGKEESEDMERAIIFAKDKINYSCMYAARNYCSWHNGSYLQFRKEIIQGFMQDNMIEPISYDKDARRDWELLNKYPFLFFGKYYFQGITEKVKRRIKEVCHEYFNSRK